MALKEKLQSYQPYHQAKLTSMNMLPSNLKQIREQVKFTYYPLGKAFEKQTKLIEAQVKNQISATRESGKQIIKSNKVVKNDFNIDRSGGSNRNIW